MRKVILYLEGDKIVSSFAKMPGDKQNLALLSFGDMCKDKPLVLGDIEVGTVSEFRVYPQRVGLVVQWADFIEQGQIIDGETIGG